MATMRPRSDGGWSGIRAGWDVQLAANTADWRLPLLWFVSPLLFGFIVTWLYLDNGRADLARVAVVGTVVAGLWNNAVYLSGLTLGGDRWLGMLERQVTSVPGLLWPTLGRVAANVAQGLVIGVLCGTIVSLTTGAGLAVRSPLGVILAVAFSLVTVPLVMMCIAPLFLVSQVPLGVIGLLEAGFVVLSGVFIRVDTLPLVLRGVAYVSPLYWIRVLAIEADGATSEPSVAVAVVALVILTVVYGAIARFVMARTERHLRTTGRY